MAPEQLLEDTKGYRGQASLGIQVDKGCHDVWAAMIMILRVVLQKELFELVGVQIPSEFADDEDAELASGYLQAQCAWVRGSHRLVCIGYVFCVCCDMLAPLFA